MKIDNNTLIVIGLGVGAYFLLKPKRLSLDEIQSKCQKQFPMPLHTGTRGAMMNLEKCITQYRQKHGCLDGETKVKLSSHEKQLCLLENNNMGSVWYRHSCQDTCRNTGEVKCGGWSGGVNTKVGGGIDFRTCVNAYNSCKKGKKCPPGSSCVGCGARGGIQMANNWCCRTPKQLEEERERSKLDYLIPMQSQSRG